MNNEAGMSSPVNTHRVTSPDASTKDFIISNRNQVPKIFNKNLKSEQATNAD